MTIDEFLAATEERIPTAREMVSLCDSIGLTFKMVDGKPCVRYKGDNKTEAEILVKLFKREPFRSEVLAAKFAGDETLPTPEPEPETIEPDEEEKRPPVEVPPGAEIIVADSSGRTGTKNMNAPHMWTWIGAEKWYYVAVDPLPK